MFEAVGSAGSLRCEERGWGEETYQVCFPGLRLVSVVVVPHGGLDPVHGEVAADQPPVSLTPYHRQL